MKKKQTLIFIILLILLCFPALKALIKPGFFQTHDGFWHLIRLREFDTALKEGQFPPRWAGGLNKSFGYPTFNFYYPFVYYLAEIPHLLGATLGGSLKIIMVLTFITSGIFMFLWAKNYWGNFGGFVSAIFYLYAPYRFVSMYVSATFGVLVAMALLPLIFLNLYLLFQKPTKSKVILCSLSLALLPLSHNVSALMFAPLIFIYWLFLLWKKKFSKKLLKKTILVIILSFSFSAFFLLPMFFELQFVRLKSQDVAQYYSHSFSTFKQIIYSPWGYGYGTATSLMSLQVGIPHLLVIFLTMITFPLFLKDQKTPKALLIIFLFNFFLFFFLMLEYSKIIWDKITLIQRFQFPSKLRAVSTFTASFLAGFPAINYLLKKALNQKTKKIILISFYLFLILFTLYANRNHLRTGDPDRYTDQHVFRDFGASTADTSSELMPIWVKKLEGFSEEKITLKEGEAEIFPQTIKGHQYLYKIKPQKESRLLVNTVYFPGWTIYANNQKIPTEITEPEGLFSFSLPEGDFEVLVKLENTPIRTIGNLLTFAAIVFSLFYLKYGIFT